LTTHVPLYEACNNNPDGDVSTWMGCTGGRMANLANCGKSTLLGQDRKQLLQHSINYRIAGKNGEDFNLVIWQYRKNCQFKFHQH